MDIQLSQKARGSAEQALKSKVSPSSPKPLGSVPAIRSSPAASQAHAPQHPEHPAAAPASAQPHPAHALLRIVLSRGKKKLKKIKRNPRGTVKRFHSEMSLQPLPSQPPPRSTPWPRQAAPRGSGAVPQPQGGWDGGEEGPPGWEKGNGFTLPPDSQLWGFPPCEAKQDVFVVGSSHFFTLKKYIENWT